MPSAQRPLNKSEYPAETSAPLSTFETAAAELENFAQKASDAATAAGKSDLDDTGIAVTFGGEASAYGDGTLAQASISGSIVDVGLVTCAFGTTSFTATATASGDTTAFAVTDSFASVTGADFVLTIDRDQATPITPEMEYSSSTSTTTFVAIDLEFWDFRNGPIVIEGSRQPDSCGARARRRQRRHHQRKHRHAGGAARRHRRELVHCSRCASARGREYAVDGHGRRSDGGGMSTPQAAARASWTPSL